MCRGSFFYSRQVGREVIYLLLGIKIFLAFFISCAVVILLCVLAILIKDGWENYEAKRKADKQKSLKIKRTNTAQ